jgi:hypothetical protein
LEHLEQKYKYLIINKLKVVFCSKDVPNLFQTCSKVGLFQMFQTFGVNLQNTTPVQFTTISTIWQKMPGGRFWPLKEKNHAFKK